jgi:hypothetical protein
MPGAWVAKMDVPGARLKQTLGFVNISSLYRTSTATDGGLDGKSTKLPVPLPR